MISRRWILVLCSVAVACVSSYTPRSNTRADLQRYVESAAMVRTRTAPDLFGNALPARRFLLL